MSILKKAVAAVMPLLAGCFVGYEESPRQYDSSGQAEATVVVGTEVEEVNYVVYRDYFGCTETEIGYFPHYRRYYGLTDDDIYFVYFTARLSGVSFDACFHSYYYDCDRNYDRLVVYYHVPRERYFVAIGADVSPPPMYARCYTSYRSGRTASATFTNQEYVALVHMKVGCEYQGHPPATYFARVQATGSTYRVLVEDRDQSGRGGHTAAGTKITATAPRPWTMPPQQKQQWHQERQASAARTEVSFKEAHKEQVTKVEKQQSAAPPKPAPEGVERKSAQDDPPPKKGPREVEQRRPQDDPTPKKARRDAEQQPPQDNPPPKAEGPGPSDPNPKHPGQKQAENPPPKHPPQEPSERPKRGEKPKGEEKGDRKDKDDKSER
jgi:hypothetical protein